jgi:hypothetical protein
MHAKERDSTSAFISHSLECSMRPSSRDEIIVKKLV